jgi:hypothetical protein
MGDARCAKHPDTVATATCRRCGAFVCIACSTYRPEGVSCASCTEVLDRPPSKHSRNAVIAALYGPIAFVVLVAAAIWLGDEPTSWPRASEALGALAFLSYLGGTGAAFVFQLLEIGRIRRGQSPGGRTIFSVAWILIALDVAAAGCVTFGARWGASV